jgi:predicted LPLAT superfamily acyltransferase
MTRWKDKAERGSDWLIRLIVWLARRFGRSFCRALLYPVVLYFMIADRTARQSSAEFLQRVHSRPARWRQVFAHFHAFAATLLDRVYMAAGEFDRFEVEIKGRPLIERALQSGRGCLLLGAHLGSFDLMILANEAMDRRPVGVMMRIDPRSRVRRLAGIDDNALNIIPLGQPDSFIRAHQLLTSGGIVAMLADRTDGTTQLATTFLGRRIAMPIAPHVLAARSGAEVLLFFGIYQGGNRYLIEFREFGPSAARDCRGAALQPMVDRYANLLEHAARRYPLNWFNFYPYWDTAGNETEVTQP